MVTTTCPTVEEARQEADKLLSHLLNQSYSITDLYQYTDKTGVPSHWRIRLDHPQKEKEIRPIALIDGEWELKEPKFSNGTPLYNLYEIYKRPDETVWIVEGEKCADALCEIGLLATTSGGATSAEKADWSALHGRHIIIWPDNDHSGIEYVRIILIILINKILTSEIVNSAQLDLPDKGDCVDWLEVNDNTLPDWDLCPLLDATSFELLYGDWGELFYSPSNLPEIPAHLLPEPFGEYAKALSQSIEVPEGLAVFGVLGAVSSSIGHRIRVTPKPDWEETTNLYLLAILPSGNNKSAVLKACTFPLTEWEKKQRELIGPEIKKAWSQRKTVEEQIKQRRSKAIKEKNHDLQKLEFHEIAEMEAGLDEIPFLPQVFLTDATPESLAKSVCEQKGRSAVISDEGGVMDVMGGLYSKGQANINIMLNGIDGGHVRIKRQEASIDINPILTFCLFAQPAVMHNMAQQRTFSGKGLLERFLYLIPETKLGYRKHNTKPISDAIKNAYAKKLTEFLDDCINTELEPSKYWLLTLGNESSLTFSKFRQEIERELRPSGKLNSVSGWGGKVCGYSLRIAGCLHVMKHGIGEGEIDMETMTRAIELTRLLIDHALIAFDDMGGNKTSDDIRAVQKWIKESGQFVFSKNDCNRAFGGRFKGVRELEEILEILEQNGILSGPIDVRTGGRGRPSIFYRVNPNLFTEAI
ncbi:MAG: DUF3987 domain-containing protein [Nitrospina sp.]|nr:DUF3987 domain-containing protein [Nitrospina sp.]